jgi:predicted NBD/HSP70 family sugar kinase
MVVHTGARAGARQDEVRRHNLATIVGQVHVEGPISRADLTTRMGLNRSTIGALTADLAAAGLVVELPGGGRGRARNGGRTLTGRPSHLVVPESERIFVLAVDIRVECLVAARVGLGGAVQDRREVAHERGHDLGAIVGVAAELCRVLLEEAKPGAVCLGVGASVPGVTRRSDGLVRFAPNLGWVDEPCGQVLAERLGLPTRVGNDANLGVVAEHMRGVARGSDDVVHLSGEVGVGGGLIVGGRPLEGFGGYAGEVGHMVVNPGGRGCRCGAKGCWETEIGEEALLRAAGRQPGGGVAAVHEVLAAAKAGQPEALAAVEHVLTWVGTGVGAIVNLFNPELVVFGGILGEVFATGPERVREAMTAATLAAPREQVRLEVAGLGADSSLLGAAELAFEPLLENPLDTLARVRPGRRTRRGR